MLLLSVVVLTACDSAQVANNIEEVTTVDTASAPEVSETQACNVAALFEPSELPLALDADFFNSLLDSNSLAVIPAVCILGPLIDVEEGLPTELQFAVGSYALEEGKTAYLVVTGPNPENPVDYLWITASFYTLQNDELVDGVEVAKIFAYAANREEYYCVLDTNGTLSQSYEHFQTNNGNVEVVAAGDTTCSLNTLLTGEVESITENAFHQD